MGIKCLPPFPGDFERPLSAANAAAAEPPNAAAAALAPATCDAGTGTRIPLELATNFASTYEFKNLMCSLRFLGLFFQDLMAILEI